eukprot:g6445.t1
MSVLESRVCSSFVPQKWNHSKCATCLQWQKLHSLSQPQQAQEAKAVVRPVAGPSHAAQQPPLQPPPPRHPSQPQQQECTTPQPARVDQTPLPTSATPTAAASHPAPHEGKEAPTPIPRGGLDLELEEQKVDEDDRTRPLRFRCFTALQKMAGFPRYPDDERGLLTNDALPKLRLCVFVSHRWTRSARGHPDHEDNSKFRLLLEGVERLCKRMAPTLPLENSHECDLLFTPLPGESDGISDGIEEKNTDTIADYYNAAWRPLGDTWDGILHRASLVPSGDVLGHHTKLRLGATGELKPHLKLATRSPRPGPPCAFPLLTVRVRTPSFAVYSSSATELLL